MVLAIWLNPVATDGGDDGIVDVLLDSDLNGIVDTVDVEFTGGTDVDGDGIDDQADASETLAFDLDGDDITDAFDEDANGDGWVDFQPVMGAASGSELPEEREPVLYTGLGGGCSMMATPATEVDPVLPGVILVALAGVFLRRWTNVNATLVAFVVTGVSLFYPSSDALAEAKWFGQKIQPHWYLGLGAGASRLEPDERSVDYELVDRSDTAMNVMLGLDVLSYLSGELQFNHLGKAHLEPSAELTYRVYGARRITLQPFNF